MILKNQDKIEYSILSYTCTMGVFISVVLLYFDIFIHWDLPAVYIESATILFFAVLYLIFRIDNNKSKYYLIVGIGIFLIFNISFFTTGGFNTSNSLLTIASIAGIIFISKGKVLDWYRFVFPLNIFIFIICEYYFPDLRHIRSRNDVYVMHVSNIEFLVITAILINLLISVKINYDVTKIHLDKSAIKLKLKNDELLELMEETKQQSEELSCLNDDISIKNQKLQETLVVLEKQGKELLTLNSHLEDLVNRRTQNLKEKNIKLASYAFFNAHVLRAPVCQILGLINLIKFKTYQDDELNTFIDMIATSIKDLNEITSKTSNLLNDHDEVSQEEIDILFEKVFDGQKKVF